MPRVDAVTSTEMLQLPPAAMVPPVAFAIETLAAPAVGTNVPPQVVLPFGVGATTIAPGVVGKASEKPTPLIA